MKKIALLFSVLCLFLCASCEENDEPTIQGGQPNELNILGIKYLDVTSEIVEDESSFREIYYKNDTPDNTTVVTDYIQYTSLNNYCAFTSTNPMFQAVADKHIQVRLPEYTDGPIVLGKWELSEYTPILQDSTDYVHDHFETILSPNYQMTIRYGKVMREYRARFVLKYVDTHTWAIDSLQGDWKARIFQKTTGETVVTKIEK